MMQNIEKLEKRLWSAADQLRSNSGLGSNEYFLPVLGILFLRQAYTRFVAVTPEVEKDLPSRGGQKRPATKDDYTKRRSIFLRPESQYEYLVNLKGDENFGKALNEALDLIEKDYDSLKGILPRNYEALADDLLKRLVGIFNDDELKRASGDVFGRIYEYFLMKFSMQGAHDNGEFFTPPSIVQMIVNVIEPDHGKVFDPACGSGGMFVQTSHFVEELHKDVAKVVTFYGQEKNETTIRIAKMNLAVHGLEGAIKNGNTFYQDEHEMLGKADFVMANPPFNVDGVDAEKIKKDPRLPFGLPGVNKSKAVSNGNYLWMSYFYSYLNKTGRAGFVMSSQASSAGHDEATVRRKIVETGHVDAMIAIRSNFFYTRSVPCELWFYDKGKPKDKLDKILMIDARNIHRKVTRKIFDFSPEQLSNLSAILWLYRGETDKYLGLVKSYFEKMDVAIVVIPELLAKFSEELASLTGKLADQLSMVKEAKGTDRTVLEELQKSYDELLATKSDFKRESKSISNKLDQFHRSSEKKLHETNSQQKKTRESFDELANDLKATQKQIEHIAKLIGRSVTQLRKLYDENEELNDKGGRRDLLQQAKDFAPPKPDSDETTLLSETLEPIKTASYFFRQIHWLQERFPDAKYVDVEGLVKLVSQKEVEKNDWSLTPGRYVGVTPNEEDDEFDFEVRLHEIHEELAALNLEAEILSKVIQKNIGELV